MKSIKPIHFVVVGIVFLVCQTGNAQLKVWDGPAIGSWEDAVNWSPNGVPEVFNSVEIGTATGTEGSRISLQTPEFIDSLQITNGSHLAVNPLSGSLAVVGATLVGGAYDGFRSELNLYPSNLVRLHTEYLTIQADGLVNNHNGADINIANLLWVQEGGELESGGTISFFDDLGVALSNSGLISSDLGGLTLEQLGNSLLDLDGSVGIGVIRVDEGNSFFGQDMLAINATELADHFSGVIEMSTASVLSMNIDEGWVADPNSLIVIVGTGVNSDGNALIEGTQLRLEGSMLLTDGWLNTGNPVDVNAPVVIADSATVELEPNNFLDFYEPVQIEGGMFITPSNSELDASISFWDSVSWSGTTDVIGVLRTIATSSVNEAATINAQKIDLDGNGFNSWQINHILNINASAIDLNDNVFDGDMAIEGLLSVLNMNMLSGESWTMAGGLYLNNSAPIPSTKLNGSEVQIDGAVVVDGSLVRISADSIWTENCYLGFYNPSSSLLLNAKSRFDGAMTVSGAGTLINSTVGQMHLGDGFFHDQVALENNGSLQIADGPGIGTVSEFQSGPAANFLFELGGYVAGSEFDFFSVTDQVAELDGRISVKLIDGFQPAIDEQFTVFSAPAGISGQFTNEPVSIADGVGYFWEVLHNPFDVTVRLVATEQNVILGDVNQDGSVDLLDVMPFVDALESASYDIRSDINCDGIVDLLDVDPFIQLLSS